MKKQMIHTGVGVFNDSAGALNETANGDLKAIKERLEAVLDSAPSDAAARIVVKKIRGGFYAFLRIYSQQRKFLVSASAPLLMEAIEKMFEEVSRQIISWKASRVVANPEWPDMA